MASTRLGSYTVNYSNLEEYHHIKREIFADHIYYFDSENPTPLIIDAGAHIGIATLYFKKMFPGARIIAIEPNPTSFKLLEQNVWENDLSDVQCINAALVVDDRTEVTLYQDEKMAWLMTTSVHEGAWSGEQKTTPIVVPTCRLADFIQEPIEMIKMDIEGSELAVMHSAKDSLPKVQKVRMEFHARTPKSLKEMLAVLKPHFSQMTAIKRNLPIEDPAHFVGLCFVSADK